MASKLKINELDFATVKSSLKEYMKSQTQFKDYNFEGSNMSVLLDVLAYNTYHNNFYSNMALNEMFLDSAVLMNSVVSHAKELNYLPRSRRSAKAVIKITITNDTPGIQTIPIPEYTQFQCVYQGQNFEFVTDKAYVAKKVAVNTFVADNVEIFEGQMLASFEREGYFVDADGILRVILSNENADTDSIVVFVDAEETENQNIFVRKNDIFGVGPTDKVFYVEPYFDGRYTIYFGNNRFGLQPLEFEDVRVRYRICSGEEPNGADVFSLELNSGTAVVETISAASGGAERESLESIRYFAPKALQIQERAITTSDYEILLKQNFPEIKAVSAYGGEDLTPPKFGRVAISVYLGEREDSLSQTLSARYIEFLRERSPVAIEPIFIESEFLYACLSIDVYYDSNITSKSPDQIETEIRSAITTYSNNNLDDFNKTLRVSKLSGDIDDVDVSIQSNEIDACPYILYSPAKGVSANPSFKFFAELVKPYPFDDTIGFIDYKPAIKTGAFTYDNTQVYIQDDGKGNIQIVTNDPVDPKVILPKTGTVDYTTGEVNLTGLTVQNYTGAGIKVMATTKRDDIKSPNGRIFFIQDEDVTINIKPIKIT